MASEEVQRLVAEVKNSYYISEAEKLVDAALTAAKAQGAEELRKSLICEAVRRSQERQDGTYHYDQPVPLWDCMQSTSPPISPLAVKLAEEAWNEACDHYPLQRDSFKNKLASKIDALLRKEGVS